MIKRLNKVVILVIVLISILAIILRTLFVWQGAVSFHYDMARDAFVAGKIWQDYDLKIIGPPTSTPGLYHGVLYYYLIAPLYALNQGDPKVVAIALSVLNTLAIIPIYLLAKSIFRSGSWGIIASLLYAVSFEATQYGPWVSNPSPAMLTIPWFFYSLWLLYQKNKAGLAIAAFFAALSTQFQFFLIYLFIVIFLFLWIFKIKITFKQLTLAMLISFLVLGTFIVSVIKFNSLQTIINSFTGIALSKQFDFRIQFTELLFNYTNRFADIFINNIFPSNVFVGGIIGFVTLYFVRKNKFILFCLLSNVLIFIFGGHGSNFTNIGMITPAILAFIFLLQKIAMNSKILAGLFLVVVILSNINMISNVAPRGQLSLVIPKDMVLKQQLMLIDKTYDMANGQPFSINSLTLPLWTNTTWAYLYNWYGKDKYGYLPSFYGRDQIGLEGDYVFQKINQPLDVSFYIIEPLDGIPPSFAKQELEEENSKTNLISEIKYSSLILQVRKPILTDLY